MKLEEMRQKLSEQLKKVERHRSETCEYLNTPMRQKDEEVCKRVDSLCFQYRMIGALETRIQLVEMKKEKTDDIKEKESII